MFVSWFWSLWTGSGCGPSVIVPDMRLDGEASLVLLLEYDELGLADVPTEHGHLAVHRPRQLLLDGRRLAVGQRHLAPEPGVCLEDLAGRRQRQTHLHAYSNIHRVK